MTDDPLLTRLDTSAAQGLQLCAEAASRIRQLRTALSDLRARHTKSRADNLAAAYAKLREEFLTLREITRDLEPGWEVDIDICEDAAKRLRERLSEIAEAADPDTIGERIVADAALVSGLERATEDLTQKLATEGGLGAKALLALGIFGQSYTTTSTSDHQVVSYGGPVAVRVHTVVDLTLRGVGPGAEYLVQLHHQLKRK